MEAWRVRIIEEARTWLGTRWHHNARVKGAGVDCGQLIIAAYVGAGLVKDFKTGAYSMDWMLHRSEERYLGFVIAHMDEVETPHPGDVAVWKFARCYSHGGIVVDWPSIIHAYRPARSVCYGLANQGELANRDVRFFSIAGRIR